MEINLTERNLIIKDQGKKMCILNAKVHSKTLLKKRGLDVLRAGEMNNAGKALEKFHLLVPLQMLQLHQMQDRYEASYP